ncbi:MAG: hypothetical protein WB239_15195 [Acidimicrobiia bacterium]
MYPSISAGDIETLGEFFADDFVDHEENPGFGHLQLHDDREFKPDRPVRFAKREAPPTQTVG